MRTVDVNVDAGEGMDDAVLFPYVTSTSIACGGHAGDDASMRQTLVLAAANGVRAGAHPSYPDRAGFGRAEMDIEPGELLDSLTRQLVALRGVADGGGWRLTHVKAHGALYNRAWSSAAVANVVTLAVLAVDSGLAVLCPPGSAQAAEARRHGLRVIGEVFADRGYDENGRLLPRDAPGAVISDPSQLRDHLRGLASIEFDTMCMHGDNPAAALLLPALRAELAAMRVAVAPYAVP
jgi:UPF0271 protein